MRDDVLDVVVSQVARRRGITDIGILTIGGTPLQRIADTSLTRGWIDGVAAEALEF